MKSAQNQRALALFAPLPARYDLLAEMLSFGQNRRWRRAMVDAALAEGPRRVLDVAIGTAGEAVLAARRGDADIVGVDLSEEMMRTGAHRLAREGLTSRVRLVRARGEELPFPDASFDAVMFTYLLRYVVDPGAAIAEMARVVRPGGILASQEFCAPPHWYWRAPWWLYTRAVLPLLGGALGGRAWYRVGRFLGPSISTHYATHPLSWHLDAWRRAGVGDVRVRVMSCGGGLVMSGVRQ